MKQRMTAKLEVRKKMDEIINSAVGGAAGRKKEEPKSQNEKDKVLTSSPREQVHHTDQIVLEISHLFQIHET